MQVLYTILGRAAVTRLRICGPTTRLFTGA